MPSGPDKKTSEGTEVHGKPNTGDKLKTNLPRREDGLDPLEESPMVFRGRPLPAIYFCRDEVEELLDEINEDLDIDDI